MNPVGWLHSGHRLKSMFMEPSSDSGSGALVSSSNMHAIATRETVQSMAKAIAIPVTLWYLVCLFFMVLGVAYALCVPGFNKNPVV